MKQPSGDLIYIRKKPFTNGEYYKRELNTISNMMSAIDYRMAIVESEEELLALETMKTRLENKLEEYETIPMDEARADGKQDLYLLKKWNNGRKVIINSTAGTKHIRYIADISDEELKENYQSLSNFLLSASFIGRFATMHARKGVNQLSLYIPHQPTLLLYKSKDNLITVDSMGPNIYLNSDVEFELQGPVFTEANIPDNVYKGAVQMILQKKIDDSADIFLQIIQKYNKQHDCEKENEL